MTRLLVECTYVFEHPKVNSGIQRVVRNVIRELPEADETVECIPVAMLDGTLYQVHSLAPLDPRPHSPLVRLRILVERAANYFWLGQRTLEKRRPFRSSPWARRLLYVACRLFAFAFLSIPLRLLDRILGKQQPAPVRATPLEHRAGDQLVLLDSSWHADFFPLAERLKSEGVGIVSVIYDLIPLTHPQFCDAGLVKVFNHWFDWIAATADGYVAISETIRDEVRAEMLRRIGPEKVAQRWFDYFHLGSELDLVEDGASVEPDLLRMFKAKAPVFLMVSTIEPRKNHGYLLDAFERAWAQGSQARLCIAGRIGWKCEAAAASGAEQAPVHVQRPLRQEPGVRILPCRIAGLPVLCGRFRPAAGGGHAARPAGDGQRHPGVPRDRRRIHGLLRPRRSADPGEPGHPL